MIGCYKRVCRKVALILLPLCSFLPVPARSQSGQNNAAARYAVEGQKALASGDYDEARIKFEELAKLEPRVGEIHATLAVIYFKERSYEKAVREIHVAQNLKPSLPKLDSLLGVSLAEMGRFSEALPGLEKGFRQTADPEIRRMCGLQLMRAYTGLHRDPEAVGVALTLTRSFPDDPEVLYHTGRVFGNYAYIVMESLRNKAPNSIWMLQAQGEANESQKDYDSAISAFHHVLSLDPHRPGIHYRLGRVYLARFRVAQHPEDRASARQEFQAELQIDPANGNAAYELAQMAAEDNDLAEARKQFESIVEKYPDFEQALVGIGGVYLDSRNGAAALAPLKRATGIDPGDEVAWYRLAKAEREAGNREAANKALETFRTLHASSAAARSSHSPDEVTPQTIRDNSAP
jgi:predicted Zn-dependent protease